MSLITPTLSKFSITPRTYGDASFQLIDPSSNNSSPQGTFTFTSSNPTVADISGRTVIIRNSGQSIITATQASTTGYNSAEITAVFTVNKATTVFSAFVIPPKEWADGSFNLTDPTSNNPSGFVYEVLTPNTISLSNRTVTLLRAGRAQIRASQLDPSANFTPSSAVATFDVVSSIVRVGTKNRIDMSWNIPSENGSTIKNYFFYTEERVSPSSPGPAVSTILDPTVTSPNNPSYYSYALPVPFYTQILSAAGLFTGIDVNFPNILFNITTTQSAAHSRSNFFDLGYYGEIEVTWEYHNDRPIVELNPDPTSIALTTMNLSIYKEASINTGDKRVDLILNTSRTYDSVVNCFGPMPQNNGKSMVDIFPITFPGILSTDTSAASRDLKYLKPGDVVSGRVSISSNTYSAQGDSSITPPRVYSILVKSLRIAPFRFPISRDFTSQRLGLGLSTAGLGFSVSTFNAPSSSAPVVIEIDSSGGLLYHMPKMTRSMIDYGKATWSFSWNYAANLSKLATDISYLPIPRSSGTPQTDLSANLNIPFHMRILGFSRPYQKTYALITDNSYNTTNVREFLTNVSDASYNTRMLFDISLNDTANYAKLAASATTPDSSFGIISRTFDISGASDFPPFSPVFDHSHTQFVFLFQLTITDPSYNTYFKTMTSQADSFQVKMLSQTFTPHQVYRFVGPDPTLTASYELDSSTNTLYDIGDTYTQLAPRYSFFNLTNGVYYSYRISSYNIVGPSTFSSLFTRRCGSVPNQIVNRINSLGADTFTIESERTSNRVNIYWEKPAFTGYEIQYFLIQTAIDISGRWVTSVEYTPDIPTNLLQFDTFSDINVNVTDQNKTVYDQTVTTYTYKTVQAQQYINTSLNLNTPLSGQLINGFKYYFRLAGVNELGSSLFSSVLSGIPFARPANSPIRFIGTPIIGNELAIITWRIPQDDAGSPILNYIIDYEEVVETAGQRDTYIKKTRYVQNGVEAGLYSDTERGIRGYPFDDFRKLYAGIKRYSILSPDERTKLNILRNELTPFVLLPRPITINETDRYLNTDTNIIDLSKNIILNYTNQTFSYKSGLLSQNTFDLSSIQLNWYYTQDTASGLLWSSGVTSSFHLSIHGHLEHNSSNRERDISNVFDISGTYTVSYNSLSTPADPTKPVYNYIDYITGNVIVGIENTPNKIVGLKRQTPPTMHRIDATNGEGYFLKLDYTMSNISRSDYRFIFYSGRVVLNGTAPVRTYSGLPTEFTVTLKSNIYSPFVNNKKYLFTVTPFNINDFFPDLDLSSNYGTAPSQVNIRMGTEFNDPVTDMSYSLISMSQGGKVVLKWKYSSQPKYYINILIPTEYAQEDLFPKEYQSSIQSDGNFRSILTPNLEQVGGIVTYTIPSSLPADIDSSNAQLYLKSGRAYEISVSPVQTFINSQNETQFIPAAYRNINPQGTYIIPFRTPLAPLTLSAQGNNGFVTLKWNLPDFTNDPNYYKTDITPAYYRYKYFTLDRRDISSSNTTWRDVSNEIFIPTQANGGVSGYQVVYSNITGTNEEPIQFRVRTIIVNEYNGERAYSGYTYMSVVNNIPITDPFNSNVYPSLYPYTPSMPNLRFGSRSSTISGGLNGLAVLFDYPAYNGNADYYECIIEYTPPSNSPGSGSNWNNVFDVSNSIADLSFNINANPSLFTTNGRFRTTAATVGGTQSFTVICRFTVLAYGVKIRLYPRINGIDTGSDGLYAPYGATLYSEYSNITFIEI